MDDEGRCRGVVALNLDDGTHPPLQRQHGHPRHRRLWPRLFLLHLGAHTCTGDGNGMVLRAGLPLQDMEFVQFHPDRHLSAPAA